MQGGGFRRGVVVHISLIGQFCWGPHEGVIGGRGLYGVLAEIDDSHDSNTTIVPKYDAIYVRRSSAYLT